MQVWVIIYWKIIYFLYVELTPIRAAIRFDTYLLQHLPSPCSIQSAVQATYSFLSPNTTTSRGMRPTPSTCTTPLSFAPTRYREKIRRQCFPIRIWPAYICRSAGGYADHLPSVAPERWGEMRPNHSAGILVYLPLPHRGEPLFHGTTSTLHPMMSWPMVPSYPQTIYQVSCIRSSPLSTSLWNKW